MNELRVLRDVVEGDLPIFFAHQQDAEANRMAAFPARDREAFTAHWRRILADNTGTKRTVLSEGQVAGNILSWDQGGKRLVGYWIGRAFWGRGLATKALAELLDEESVRPLHAYVAKSNVASIRVLEKCGFVVCESETHYDERLGEAIEELLLVLA